MEGRWDGKMEVRCLGRVDMTGRGGERPREDRQYGKSA